MIRLYQHPLSPYCHRVRIVLAEKGLDYETINIDFAKKENKSDSFLRLNPLGKIPVLADDDLVISDSKVINEYLNDEYPYPELLPDDIQQRALARRWAARIDDMVVKPYLEIYFASREKEAGQSVDEVKMEANKLLIFRFYEGSEKVLKTKQYLVGSFSLADVALAPCIEGLEKFSLGPPEHLAATQAYFKRLGTRPSVAKTRA